VPTFISASPNPSQPEETEIAIMTTPGKHEEDHALESVSS
jgi:hypothetical protein